MKTFVRSAPLFFSLFIFSHLCQAQLYKVDLDEKINHSQLIVEGKVIAKKSFWNDAHNMIYTANTIEIYKVFKGNVITKTVEVMTQGGSVGTRAVSVSDLLQLDMDKVGIFFCEPNQRNIQSPTTKKLLYDIYSSDQGFLRYDVKSNKANAPFASYDNIETSLYNAILQKTGQPIQVLNKEFKISAGNVSHTETGDESVSSISSFSPLKVMGGALNDPANNLLTINGSGFGAVPSGSCAIRFKDGNSNLTTPTYSVAYTSSYIKSWSDTKITIKVPARAATGNIAVVLSNGSITQSATALTVYYSVLNFDFDFSSEGIDTVVGTEPRLMNANGTGGYTYQYSTSTAGNGINFATSDAKGTFLRALSTWKAAVGVNFTEGATTTVQKIDDDNINLVVFDNTNTGVPAMGAGVLEVTYSWGSTCFISSPFSVYNAQKTGFDILIRNDAVSVGTTSFTTGPCFPFNTQYDLETVLLHEIGHALDLAHVNADVEGSTIPNVNPEKVMHYAITNYVDRRSLDNSAYSGGSYAVKKQGNIYGNCGLYTSEMTLLSTTVISNDECPATFASVPTIPGTVLSFDLAHATSNINTDPQSTAVSCSSNITNVTNNAYYSFKTSAAGDLSLSISGYTTTPADIATCTGQGVRMAVYDVSVCPSGQNYPQPVACKTFAGNGNLTPITGLQANHSYLLYFDGIRNTKAAFSATINGSSLPLTISKFTGEYLNGINYLYIDILQAAGIKTIAVEKSSDAVHFSQLGTLPFTASNLLGSHTYPDPQPFTGNNYYRLLITNNDGSVEYSSTILLTNEAKSFVYIYPNPVKSMLNISINAETAGKYNVILYDMSGKILTARTYQAAAGSQVIHIPVNQLAAGAYFIKVEDEKGNVISRRNILKQ